MTLSTPSLVNTISISLKGAKVECLAHEEKVADLSSLTGDVQIDVNLGPSNTSLQADPEIITEVMIMMMMLMMMMMIMMMIMIMR